MTANSPILVTGGAGYIGSHTVRLLARQGRRIVVLDNLEFGHEAAIVDPGVELARGDVADRELLDSLFRYYVDPETGLFCNQIERDGRKRPVEMPIRVLYHLELALAEVVRWRA